ncbi:hypothetical protein [Pseudescherichia vulneris]|uniref:hypothetical protein n=1 Tax=Pseudescherichia vulneris TaxID=566 RepID=UPI0028D513D9|nr:hypothetical protein [Pseudescherichia vulneris]
MNKKIIFNISHIIGFFIGVLITITINWLLFKDPKKITAPGVAALITMCTFSLALYSAYQVKKWLNSKINETAFKKTDDFISELCTINNKILEVIFLIKKLELMSKKEEYNKCVEELFTCSLELKKSIMTAYNHSYTFPTWSIKFVQRKLFDKANGRVGFMLGFIEHTKHNDLSTFEKRNKFLRNLRSQLGYLESASFMNDIILSKPYHKKFSKENFHV